MATKEINTPIVDTKTKNGKVTPITTANGGGNGNSDYNADSIKVLGGMEAVRKRPAMYIGSTGELGLHHLVYEVVDNSVDEALAGFATKIEVTIHLDNSITVVDDGRGIPVDDMEIDGEKVSAAQVVMTTLHAGGKFDSSTYKVSGGLHGVGVSCVNALSEEVELEIWRDGATWQQNVFQGRAHQQDAEDRRRQGEARDQGSLSARPLDFHRTREYNYDTLAQRLRELAFLNKGLLITLTDERNTDSKTGEPKHTEFKYNGGIAEFIKHLNRGKQVLHDKPIYMEAERNGVVMEIGLQYNDAYSEIGVQLRQQHQHRRRRHASLGIPHGPDPHHQLRRTADGPVQGREGESDRRRRARRPGRRDQREAAAAAVRRTDQGQAEF